MAPLSRNLVWLRRLGPVAVLLLAGWSALVLSASPPPPLEQAILRCLDKDRTKRFPNVGELAAAIAPFATDEGIGSAERALRTIDKSIGGPGTTTLSPANLRATRNSMMAGGTRTGSSWSTSAGSPVTLRR